MEPEAGLAWRDGDRLRLVVATQSPHKDIADIRSMFWRSNDLGNLRIDLDARPPGGAFGGRDSSSFPLYLALAAVYAGAPLRMALSRFEQFQSGIKRHASAVRTRIAVDEGGTLQALLSHTVLDGGGQPNLSRPVMGVAALHAAGPYRIPRTAAGVSAIHTDAAPAGSMRGFGIPQVAFCVETMVDEIASARGEDAIAYRKRHVLRRGERDMTGMTLEHHIANRALCELAARESLWKKRQQEKERRDRDGLAYGVGFAMCMEAYGTTRDGVLAEVAVDREGKVTVRSAGVDFGQGTGTALAIATEPWLGQAAGAVELGHTQLFDALALKSGDDAGDPRTTPKLINSMSASMTAFHHVHGVEEACKVVLDHGLRPAAAAIWGRDASAARFSGGKLRLDSLRALTLAELAARAHDDGLVSGAMIHTYYQGEHASADYTVDGTSVRRTIDALAVTRAGERRLVDRESVSYPSGATLRYRRSLYASIGHLVAVEVDMHTGRVACTDAITILDAGEVHHEALLRGQVEGGFAMGLGFALLEELPPAPGGAARDWNLHRYEVPRARHLPLERMKLVLVPLEEDLLKNGPPIRKKGIAEASMSTVAPALANAIAHATGARMNVLPMTPTRILEALS
jgi:CO/xanthine dehydrogenase Mo-binding subunit